LLSLVVVAVGQMVVVVVVLEDFALAQGFL
jgi:hypothetical protein